MITLDESRDMLRNSYEEFKREQNEYRKQLEEITKHKELAIQRRKGNVLKIQNLPHTFIF